MKVEIYSEEYPDGLTADWPAIPREGEIVSFHHTGGVSDLRVESVRWHVETDGSPRLAEIHLSF